MKLNNKGFAITSVLYGLLILFVSLVGTYLAVLVSKMNRLNNISDDINDKYGFNAKLDVNQIITSYTAKYTGKYVFTINNDLTCISYIAAGTIIDKQFNNITFTTKDCNNIKGYVEFASLTKIWHNGDDTSE